MDKIDVKIDWNTKNNVRKFKAEYDADLDSLTMRSNPPCPAIAVNSGSGIWVRVIPRTGEIVGIEIEEFKRVFLKKYPEFLRDEDEVESVARFIDKEPCLAYG